LNPTIKEVSAISLLSARNWNAQPREAMISITGTDEPRVPLKKGWAYTLRLVFDDLEEPRPGRNLFSEADADKVIDFLNRIEGKVDHVVVHCTHGLSRAPAIARYISPASRAGGPRPLRVPNQTTRHRGELSEVNTPDKQRESGHVPESLFR
jgi:predicted protein tyrosine phosphatase